ncbi:deoxycytidylate deaminase [Bradyrhizobium sp. i1.7.7]
MAVEVAAVVFDGAWAVVSVGCGGSTSGAVVVSSGKIIGEGVRGTVSTGGSVSTFGQGQGVTFTSTGRLSGRSGSGTWRRSDGCGGTWSSAKQ